MTHHENEATMIPRAQRFGRLQPQSAKSIRTGTALKYNLNHIGIQLSEYSITVFFSASALAGTHRVNAKYLSNSVKAQNLPSTDDDFYYISFEEQKNAVPVLVNLYEDSIIGKPWIQHLLNAGLQRNGLFLKRNYLNDTEVWVKTEQRTNEHALLERFTLKVMFINDRYVLRVNYAGSSRVIISTLRQMRNSNFIKDEYINLVLHGEGKEVFPYRNLLDNPNLMHTISDEALFPVLNRNLAGIAGINPGKPVKQGFRQRYKNLKSFTENHLTGHFSQGSFSLNDHFESLPENCAGQLALAMPELKFGASGKGSANAVMASLKQYGPYVKPGFAKIVVFIIHEAGMAVAKEMFSGISRPLQDYLKMDCYYDAAMNIEIAEGEELLTKVRKRLDEFEPEAGTGYLAFHISRWGKFDVPDGKYELVPQLRELLLSRNIALQNLENQKIINARDSFRYFIPNLAIAAVAKLGGIPFVPDVSSKSCLTVGFGLYRTSKYAKKFVGSAVSFSTGEHFSDIDVFPEGKFWEIKNALIRAIKKYIAVNKSIDMLVIHYYKQFNGKEMRSFESTLALEFKNIPVWVMSVSRHAEYGTLATVSGSDDPLPLNGTFIKTGLRHYLLYQNNHHLINDHGSKDKSPLSVYFTGNRMAGELNKMMAARLLNQLNAFSFMNWRSVTQQSLPATLLFTKLTASDVAWFEHKVLPGAQRMLFSA